MSNKWSPWRRKANIIIASGVPIEPEDLLCIHAAAEMNAEPYYTVKAIIERLYGKAVAAAPDEMAGGVE